MKQYRIKMDDECAMRMQKIARGNETASKVVCRLINDHYLRHGLEVDAVAIRAARQEFRDEVGRWPEEVGNE